MREDLEVCPMEATYHQVGKTPEQVFMTHGWPYIKDAEQMPDHVSTDDITANRHGGHENSKEAHKKALKNAARDRKRILDYLDTRLAEGATCDELEQALDLSHQTCSARCSDLKRSSQVMPSGQKRKTRKGVNADVLIL